MALVDDSILSRWPPAKKAGAHTRPVTPARPQSAPVATATVAAAAADENTAVSKNITVSAPQPRPKAIVHGLLNRAQAFRPLRLRAHTVLAY